MFAFLNPVLDAGKYECRDEKVYVSRSLACSFQISIQKYYIRFVQFMCIVAGYDAVTVPDVKCFVRRFESGKVL